MKKWDLPKTKGVITEKIGVRLRRDHFTSLLLANDAARGYLGQGDEGDVFYSTGGIALRNRPSNIKVENTSMYKGRGMKKMKKSKYNQGNNYRNAKGDMGNSIGY
jgi:hypothetical protein